MDERMFCRYLRIHIHTAYRKNPKKFIEFWNEERKTLTEKNAEGFRAIDAGPVTMGYRLSNDRTGLMSLASLIYPKGAYILHMLRMMMWDRSNQRPELQKHDA